MWSTFEYALWVLTVTQFCACHLRLDINPAEADIEQHQHVTILCSLNLNRAKIERVYSIMIKRSGTPIGILLPNNEYHFPKRRYHVDGSLTANERGNAFFEIMLDDVTCANRGDYSCEMAVSRSYKSLTLGPVNKLLNIIGNPVSGITNTIIPQKLQYRVGERLKLRCSTLRKLKSTNWTWSVNTPPNHQCQYLEEQCYFSCWSEIEHIFTENYMSTAIRCVIDGNIKVISFDRKTLAVDSEQTRFAAIHFADLTTPSQIKKSDIARSPSKTTTADISDMNLEGLSVLSGEDVEHDKHRSQGDQWPAVRWIIIITITAIALVGVSSALICVFCPAGCWCKRNGEGRYSTNVSAYVGSYPSHRKLILVPVKDQESRVHNKCGSLESEMLLPNATDWFVKVPPTQNPMKGKLRSDIQNELLNGGNWDIEHHGRGIVREANRWEGVQAGDMDLQKCSVSSHEPGETVSSVDEHIYDEVRVPGMGESPQPKQPEYLTCVNETSSRR